MKLKQTDSLSFSVDPSIPAVYVYLIDREQFRVSKTIPIDDLVNVDLNATGDVIGVEMLGPGSLDTVLNIVVPKYHVTKLAQIAESREWLEQALQHAR